MKVTLKYEEHDSKELHMTLRLTLPQKYVNGHCKEVVKLFVDHYNKKHTEDALDKEALHLKIVGGDHLESDDRVKDVLSGGDECYLLPEHTRVAKTSKAAPSEQSAYRSDQDVEMKTASAPAPCTPQKEAGAGKVVKNDKGQVRCKNFGCQRWYDPDGEPPECIHHKAAPIFHETAKWWSCCPDRKAYDWDEFMRIPGCTKSVCSNVTQGKRVLGGCDLRGDTAPERIDADAPIDPRKKLNDVRNGLVAIGVDPMLFEKVWGQLYNDLGDTDKVVDQFRMRFAAVLNSV
jgi:hypothetical protein